MLKITTVDSPKTIVLRLEGRLTERWIETLQHAVAAATGRTVHLDLSGLSHVDDAGARVLGDLIAKGLSATEPSAFVREVLNQQAGPDDDARLIAALRLGDASARERIVRSACAAMLPLARCLLGEGPAAASTVFAAFRTAFASIEEKPGKDPVAQWLRRLTVSAAIAEMRTRPDDAGAAIESLLPAFERDGHWAEPWPMPNQRGGLDGDANQAARLRIGIDRLPVDHRAVLLLCDVERLDRYEAANLLGITVELVGTRLHEARMAVCEHVRRADADRCHTRRRTAGS